MASGNTTMLVAAFVFALNMGPSFAWARPTNPARLLFQEARKAAVNGDCATAYPKFVDSYRLEPAVGTLLNIADCQRRQEKPVAAWVSFRKALDGMALNDDRRNEVVSLIEELQKQLPRLSLRLLSTASTSSVVELDGQLVNASSLGVALPVEPGRHSIVVKANGRQNRTYEILILKGETKEQTVTSESVSKTQFQDIRALHPASSARVEFKQSSSSRVPQYVASGIGGLGLLTGIITRVAAFQQKSKIDSHCSNTKACDSSGMDAVSKAKTYQTASTVSLIVGATSIGFCLYFVLSSNDKRERQIAISPVVANTAVGLAISRGY